MQVLWFIYKYSILGNSLCILLITIMITVQYRKGIEESYKNHPYYMSYKTFENAPFYYKLLLVLLPGINTIFTLLFIVLIYKEASYLWFNIGKWITKRLSGDPNDMKFFKLKAWFVRVFFNRWIDLFFKRYEYDIIERIFKKILKKKSDEKADNRKDQKEQSESEQESGRKAVKSDQEALEPGPEPDAD